MRWGEGGRYEIKASEKDYFSISLDDGSRGEVGGEGVIMGDPQRICGCGAGPPSKSHFPLGQPRKRDFQGNYNRGAILSFLVPSYRSLTPNPPNQPKTKTKRNLIQDRLAPWMTGSCVEGWPAS